MGAGVRPGVAVVSMSSLRFGAGVQVGVSAMSLPGVTAGLAAGCGFTAVAEGGSGVSRLCEPVSARLQPQICNALTQP